jgi:hypothetical protein
MQKIVIIILPNYHYYTLNIVNHSVLVKLKLNCITNFEPFLYRLINIMLF